ncbi:hypothetical protein [Nonomuraea sp. NPDC048916]|uniref:hypothetical protein n=1 Tax=Nonomuraea sp. NPDC048916 TaxID=3154232 RepID=UPI0033D7E78F
MLDSLIVPLFITTDLPPGADLAGFGELLAETARTLDHDGASYEAFLAGKVFWLDRPVLPRQRPAADVELRFAGMLGHLAASGPGHTPAGVVADVRRAVSAAVAARYGEVGAAPAVFAIRDRDVRERTPDFALYIDTHDAVPDLVTATRPFL